MIRPLVTSGRKSRGQKYNRTTPLTPHLEGAGSRCSKNKTGAKKAEPKSKQKGKLKSTNNEAGDHHGRSSRTEKGLMTAFVVITGQTASLEIGSLAITGQAMSSETTSLVKFRQTEDSLVIFRQTEDSGTTDLVTCRQTEESGTFSWVVFR